jgi:hypothetical protein
MLIVGDLIFLLELTIFWFAAISLLEFRFKSVATEYLLIKVNNKNCYQQNF